MTAEPAVYYRRRFDNNATSYSVESIVNLRPAFVPSYFWSFNGLDQSLGITLYSNCWCFPVSSTRPLLQPPVGSTDMYLTALWFFNGNITSKLQLRLWTGQFQGASFSHTKKMRHSDSWNCSWPNVYRLVLSPTLMYHSAKKRQQLSRRSNRFPRAK